MVSLDQIKALQVFLNTQFGVLAHALDKPSNLLSLQDILHRYQLTSMDELLAALNHHQHWPLRDAVLSLACAHETSWFRDQYPYDLIRQRILPDHYTKNASNSELRIWSAACSKGQEPYSIAMTVLSFLALNAYHNAHQCSIVATDVSSALIDYAKKGIYSPLEVSRGLPLEALNHYFRAHTLGYLIEPAVKQPVAFTVHNLLDDFSALGQFDMIFCRNVLLYFSKSIQIDILQKLYLSLKKGGYLFLGASEIMPYLPCFDMIQYPCGIVYRAKPQ